MNNHFRHELKHDIDYFDYIFLTAKIKHIAEPDAHASSSRDYKVRSLYFDNYEDKALREKINGYATREKFRLRYYNDDIRFIRLEKKSKQNGLCRKVSAPISKEQVELLLRGDYDFLKESKHPLFCELYVKMHTQLLRPVTIVDYMREAYVYPAGNVRITVDRDMAVLQNPAHFLNTVIPTMPLVKSMVLEVKYDAYLPQFLADMVQLPQKQSNAFSKYAFARAF